MIPKSSFRLSRRALIVLVAFIALESQNLTMAQAPAGASPAPATSTAPELLARFESTINTKSAHEGDAVTTKITRNLKLKDLDIPKNSKLVGKITTVQSEKAGNGNSILAIKFDHVELKGGAILRIQGLIDSIASVPEGETGLGYNSVLSRGGVGSNASLDPSIAADKYDKDKDLPKGSTLEGVALSLHFDPSGASVLRGVHRDIKVDPDILIRVAMFKGN